MVQFVVYLQYVGFGWITHRVMMANRRETLSRCPPVRLHVYLICRVLLLTTTRETRYVDSAGCCEGMRQDRHKTSLITTSSDRAPVRHVMTFCCEKWIRKTLLS